MTHVVIAGGSGLIGRAWLASLPDSVTVTCIGRDPGKISRLLPAVQAVSWHDSEGLNQAVGTADVVVNLAGENIGAKRWSAAQKQRIIDSRVTATQTLVDVIHAKGAKVQLINASAIGIYGLQPMLEAQRQTIYTESSLLPSPPSDFLAEVGAAWEAPLKSSKAKDISITVCRFAVVLSRQGGMLQQLLLPYRLGLGGVVGSGEQPLSWVAIDDVVRVLNFFAFEHQAGTFNIVAPGWLTQRDFAKAFAKALSRPAVVPLPSAVVKLLFGEMGETLLLSGQAVATEQSSILDKLIQLKTLDEALTDLLRK